MGGAPYKTKKNVCGPLKRPLMTRGASGIRDSHITARRFLAGKYLCIQKRLPLELFLMQVVMRGDKHMTARFRSAKCGLAEAYEQ